MNWWVVKRRIHISWLIAVIAAGCVAGVVLAAYVPIGWFSHYVWILVGGLLLALSLCFRYVAVLVLCLGGGMLIGLWRGSVDRADLVMYDSIRGYTVELRGKVQEDIDQRSDGHYVMKLGSVVYDTTPLPGVVWVTFSSDIGIARSDIVTIRGKISEGFGNIPTAVYGASVVKVERPDPGDIALHVRDVFGSAVRSVVPEPEVSLGLGYLLGQRRALPEELSEALRIAGLTHVIVASGYNLTILVRFARRLFARISRYTALMASSGLVLSFIAVTGMSPSMSRAGLVTGLSLLAWYYGRKFHPLVLLPIAAAVTVLVNPSYAWGDVGWQLSFAAFGGVMILAPLLQAYFFGDKKARDDPPNHGRDNFGTACNPADYYHSIRTGIECCAHCKFTGITISSTCDAVNVCDRTWDLDDTSDRNVAGGSNNMVVELYDRGGRICGKSSVGND